MAAPTLDDTYMADICMDGTGLTLISTTPRVWE
jgi:hypothetical protein